MIPDNDKMELVGGLAIKGPEACRMDIKTFLNEIRTKKIGRALMDGGAVHKIINMPDPDAEICNGSVPSHLSPAGKCKSITDVAAIEFSPGCKDPMWPDDESLVHELLHAVRKSWGLRDCNPLPAGLGRFDSRKEFFAILVANIYTSEKQNKAIEVALLQILKWVGRPVIAMSRQMNFPVSQSGATEFRPEMPCAESDQAERRQSSTFASSRPFVWVLCRI